MSAGTERTAVAAMQLRMRMRILTRPENLLANFGLQISDKKLRIQRCELICQRRRMVLRMKWRDSGSHNGNSFRGNPNGGLANGGLAQKAPIGNWAKKSPFGGISAASPRL